MKRLNELIDRVGNLASEGVGLRLLYPALQRFFSREDVQRKLIEFNQSQLFNEEVGRNNNTLGSYTHRVALRKQRAGLPSTNYTLYNTGTYFRTMAVEPGEEGVEIVSSDRGAGIDSIGRGVRGVHTKEGIDWMFRRYDPNRTSLGVTDDNFDNFVETSGIKSNLITEIDEYLDGKNTY